MFQKNTPGEARVGTKKITPPPPFFLNIHFGVRVIYSVHFWNTQRHWKESWASILRVFRHYNCIWLFDWHTSPLLGELVGRSEHLPGNVHGPRQSRDSGGTENGQELAMYTIQCTLYNVHCIMDTIQWTLYSRGLSINPKFLKKLLQPVLVFVLLCWFRNSFSFLIFNHV